MNSNSRMAGSAYSRPSSAPRLASGRRRSISQFSDSGGQVTQGGHRDFSSSAGVVFTGPHEIVSKPLRKAISGMNNLSNAERPSSASSGNRPHSARVNHAHSGPSAAPLRHPAANIYGVSSKSRSSSVSKRPNFAAPDLFVSPAVMVSGSFTNATESRGVPSSGAAYPASRRGDGPIRAFAVPGTLPLTLAKTTANVPISNTAPTTFSPQNPVYKTYENKSSSSMELTQSTPPKGQGNISITPTNTVDSKDDDEYRLSRQIELESKAKQHLQRLIASNTFDGKSTSEFYGFGKVVGVGSFAYVRLAWHRLAGARVAIKTYERERLTEPSHLRTVHQEIRLQSQLAHPNIVRQLETLESPKRIHIVMEYLGGGNLCQLLKRRRKLPESEARNIFVQILSALDYMHTRGVIHRDVKLENVLIADDGTVKLTDFGFAALSADPKKKLSVFCGTPSYMAPEVAGRMEYLGRPVDVWALGVLLFASVAGRFPFSAKSYPELYQKIIAGVVSFPDFFSPLLCDLLKRMMHPVPELRLTLANALSHPWVVAKQGYNALSLATGNCSLAAPVSPFSLLPSEDVSVDVNEDLVRCCEALGFRRGALLTSLMNKQHDAAATTYYLLIGRFGRKYKAPVSTSAPTASSANPSLLLDDTIALEQALRDLMGLEPKSNSSPSCATSSTRKTGEGQVASVAAEGPTSAQSRAGTHASVAVEQGQVNVEERMSAPKAETVTPRLKEKEKEKEGQSQPMERAAERLERLERERAEGRAHIRPSTRARPSSAMQLKRESPLLQSLSNSTVNRSSNEEASQVSAANANAGVNRGERVSTGGIGAGSSEQVRDHLATLQESFESNLKAGKYDTVAGLGALTLGLETPAVFRSTPAIASVVTPNSPTSRPTSALTLSHPPSAPMSHPAQHVLPAANSSSLLPGGAASLQPSGNFVSKVPAADPDITLSATTAAASSSSVPALTLMSSSSMLRPKRAGSARAIRSVESISAASLSASKPASVSQSTNIQRLSTGSVTSLGPTTGGEAVDAFTQTFNALVATQNTAVQSAQTSAASASLTTLPLQSPVQLRHPVISEKHSTRPASSSALRPHSIPSSPVLALQNAVASLPSNPAVNPLGGEGSLVKVSLSVSAPEGSSGSRLGTRPSLQQVRFEGSLFSTSMGILGIGNGSSSSSIHSVGAAELEGERGSQLLPSPRRGGVPAQEPEVDFSLPRASLHSSNGKEGLQALLYGPNSAASANITAPAIKGISSSSASIVPARGFGIGSAVVSGASSLSTTRVPISPLRPSRPLSAGSVAKDPLAAPPLGVGVNRGGRLLRMDSDGAERREEKRGDFQIPSILRSKDIAY